MFLGKIGKRGLHLGTVVIVIAFSLSMLACICSVEFRTHGWFCASSSTVNWFIDDGDEKKGCCLFCFPFILMLVG